MKADFHTGVENIVQSARSAVIAKSGTYYTQMREKLAH